MHSPTIAQTRSADAMATTAETANAQSVEPSSPDTTGALTREVTPADVVAVVIGETGAQPRASVNPIPGFVQDKSEKTLELWRNAAWEWNVFDDCNLYTCVASDNGCTDPSDPCYIPGATVVVMPCGHAMDPEKLRQLIVGDLDAPTMNLGFPACPRCSKPVVPWGMREW